MLKPFPRQLEVLKTFLSNRTTIVHGPVGCGKTDGAVYAFILWSLQFKNEQFGLASVNLRQVRKTVYFAVEHALEGTGIEVRLKGGNQPELIIGSNVLMFFAAENMESVKRLLGFNLQGMLIDEIHEVEESFYYQAEKRCRRPGAKLIATCNPKGPYHWAKKHLVDNDDVGTVGFDKDDNPYLDAQYKAALRNRLHGADLQRDYYGLWVADEGAVYPNITVGKPTGKILRYWNSIDYGEQGNTHALQFNEYDDGTIWIDKEWRSSPAQDLSQQYDNWKAQDFTGPTHADPAALPLKKFWSHRGHEVHDAVNKPVYDGIQIVNRFLSNGTLKINDRCHILLDEIAEYVWDEKALNRGDDKPVKIRDHAVDAMRYGFLAWARYSRKLPKLTLRVPEYKETVYGV